MESTTKFVCVMIGMFGMQYLLASHGLGVALVAAGISVAACVYGSLP